jgi:hypothetical protein
MLPLRKEIWEHWRSKQRVQIIGTAMDVTRPQPHMMVLYLEMDSPAGGVKAQKMGKFMGNISDKDMGIHTWNKIQDASGKRI